MVGKETLNSTSFADSYAASRAIYFPGDWFWLNPIGLGVLGAVYSFKAYVDGHLVLSIGSIFFVIIWTVIRARYAIRSPEWALIDPVGKVLRLKQRWPHRSEVEIDIGKMESVKAYVQRFRKYPRSVVELSFEGQERREIFFDVESSETRFFACPNEVLPPTVIELANLLSEVACKNQELKQKSHKSELETMYEKIIEGIRSS